ncbi:Lsr2 family protein [Streptomyces virginiae]|uniref:histone-like nucleoid-structuring protein Lsr2 n=1 Tax=Streptomyces virginiae TaxID=1961 RepID=UPI0036E39BA0
MAQKVEVTLIDDLDGSEATQTVVFALDGKTYEIDLSDGNAEKLRGDLAPFLGAARKTSGGRASARRMGSGRPADDTAAIRAWAKEKGYDVNDRGRVPAKIREAFAATQAA